MQALFLSRDHALRICPTSSIPTTELPPGTVVVRPRFASICGSDLLSISHPRPVDGCPGSSIHEVVGEVDFVVGPSCFSKGDLVLALPTNYLQASPERKVLTGLPECVQATIMDLPTRGGMATEFVSHDSCCFLIPKETTVPLKNFTAAQPMATLLWAAAHLGPVIGTDCVVLGSGQNGIMMCHLLSNLGARSIIAVDPLSHRLGVAKKMRATHTIQVSGENTDKLELHQQILKCTEGRGASTVIEMVGHQAATINVCLHIVNDGGTVLAFGVPTPGEIYPLEFGVLFRKNIRLVGSVFPKIREHFQLGVDHISQGRIDVTPVFTHEVPVNEAVDIIQTCLDRSDGVIKAVVRF